MSRQEILLQIKKTILPLEYILSAKIYGSWMFKEESVDCDIAIIIPSSNGIIEEEIYKKLIDLRKSLFTKLKIDIDLIPHTEDEFYDIRSPLWYPRYNPALIFGETIKGVFTIKSSSVSGKMFSFSDLAAYVILDNRTICRRQLLRSLANEQGRIFISKLIHGPGNVLTYFSCRTKTKYMHSPSDIAMCFYEFDKIYKTDSSLVLNFINTNKVKFDQDCGIKMMNWYEGLVTLVFGKINNYAYNNIVSNLSK